MFWSGGMTSEAKPGFKKARKGRLILVIAKCRIEMKVAKAYPD